ncbi:MAG: hypothetical protein AAFQ94_04100 [Bacteroidota bacterium]
MKLLKITTIICMMFFLAGCGKKEGQKENPSSSSYRKVPTTTIVGKIENPGDYLIEFVVKDSTIIVDLNEDNTFTFTTDQLDQPGEIDFIHHQKAGALYVIPGTQLTFNTDYNLLFLNAEFEGPTADNNRYLFKKYMIQQSSDNPQVLYSSGEKEFLSKIDQLKNDKLQLLYSYKVVFGDSAYFKTEQGNILYEWANRLMSYGNMHAMMLNIPVYETGDSLKNLLKAIPLERPQLLNSYRYVNFVFDQITQKANESMASATVAADQVDKVMLDASVEQTNKLITNEQIKKRLISEFVNSYYLSMNEADRYEALQQYQQYLTTENIEKLKKTAKEYDADQSEDQTEIL